MISANISYKTISYDLYVFSTYDILEIDNQLYLYMSVKLNLHVATPIFSSRLVLYDPSSL